MYLLDYWKDIPGFKRHQASYSGKIRHLGKIAERRPYVFCWQSERILECYYEKGAYAGISISIDGNIIYKKVHILVALAFIPNPDCLPEVNHINLDKWDNSANNLEWCTHKQNMEHASKMGRMKSTGRKKKQKVPELGT